MSRRSGRSRRDGSAPSRWSDPLVALGADRAWRADDAIDNGSVTTSLPNYIGTALPLPRQGAAGQAIKAASANFNNRLTIACAPAGLGYGATALGVAPTNFTMVTVGRYAATGVGMSALTVAGAINTGLAQLHLTGAVNSRKVAADVAVAVAPPVNVVHVSVWDNASNVRNYTNSKSAVSASIGGALAGTDLHLMCLSSSNLLVLNGEWARSAYWTRALSAAEAGFLLDRLGAYYGVAISP